MVKARIRAINPEKSKFCRSQVKKKKKYLSLLVQKKGLRVDPDKTQPIVDYLPPKTITVCIFVRAVDPVVEEKVWEKEDPQKLTFEAIKQAIIFPPILLCLDFEKPFVLQTDASLIGLGAVLTQQIERACYCVYKSRVIRRGEKVFYYYCGAIKKFRSYL